MDAMDNRCAENAPKKPLKSKTKVPTTLVCLINVYTMYLCLLSACNKECHQRFFLSALAEVGRASNIKSLVTNNGSNIMIIIINRKYLACLQAEIIFHN